MPPDVPRLVLTSRVEKVRRELRPSEWVVLEALAANAAAGSTVKTTVRELASEVGLNKDTATRAVQRLLDDGLVSRLDLRENGSGRFGPSRYTVVLDAAGFIAPRPTSSDTEHIASAVASCGPAPHPQPSTTHPDVESSTRPDSHRQVDPNQLTLIDP